jgi:RimJ/RimL family protein N-acetyltransferase
MALRPAGSDDAEVLWQWANEPRARAMSFSKGPIPWEEHVAWLEATLADPGRWLFIAELEGTPIAQVRFDALDEDGTAEISVSVAADARGRGLGALVITEGTSKMFAETDVDVVVARVFTENRSSVQAFEGAGYTVTKREGDMVTFNATRQSVPHGG